MPLHRHTYINANGVALRDNPMLYSRVSKEINFSIAILTFTDIYFEKSLTHSNCKRLKLSQQAHNIKMTLE